MSRLYLMYHTLVDGLHIRNVNDLRTEIEKQNMMKGFASVVSRQNLKKL